MADTEQPAVAGSGTSGAASAHWGARPPGTPDAFELDAGMAGDFGTPMTPSSPLAEGEPEGIIPPSPLWPMKSRRHFQWSHLLPHGEQSERVRVRLGEGGETVYAMDDGQHHCIIGRQVGQTGDGCGYSLVARIAREQFDDLAAGRTTARDAFLQSRGLALFGVVEAGPASNIIIVGTYGGPADVPEDYLPPHGPIDFAEDLDEF